MDASGRSALGERKDPVNVEMQTLSRKLVEVCLEDWVLR